MKTILAFDIGGTNIRTGLFSEESIEPLTIKKIRTTDKNHSALDNILSLIEETLEKYPSLTAISMAVPGSVDNKQGIVFNAPNVDGWKNVPLRQIIKEKFNINPFIENDASMAAYGEWKHGAGRGHNYLIYMTISTGVGGAVIDDGHLLTGFRGLGTEKGHMTIVENGPLCSCGQPGHLEALASGTAIAAYIRRKMAEGAKSLLEADPAPTAEMIAKAARNGDALSIEAFNSAGYYLGIGLASYLHIFNPSCIILGGGVSFSGDLFYKPLYESLKEHVMNEQYLVGLEIKYAEMGDKAGLIGAYQWSLDNL